MTTVMCGHSAATLILLGDDKKVNTSRQNEQKDIRKIGEVFIVNLQYTCGYCGEKINMPTKIRRV